jgi:hypothetical protein
MAVKTAFLLASYQLRVSGDWVVGLTGIEPLTRRFRSIDAIGDYDGRPNSLVEWTARIE